MDAILRRRRFGYSRCVSLATAKKFLEAGAFALGVGSDLVNAKAMAEGKPEVVTESAKKYLGIVKEFSRCKEVFLEPV
ncbi:MAG: hypothetical protein ACRD3K_05345 [Edaphobacter sp.]